jgi:hypothetical protein
VVLSRRQLTAALAARQMLLERQRLPPAEAIRRLTPLQGQHPPAPYIALAARLDGFRRADLEAAIERREVVRTTIMRMTLHLAAAADYPAYAQFTRQSRMRQWRKTYPHLDEHEVIADLGKWLREPRTNPEIREHVRRYDGVPDDPYRPIFFARNLLPLVQLPPAGYYDAPARSAFVVDPRPLPDPIDAAAHVLARYLAAFGPASRRDAAAWSKVAQQDYSGAWERVPTVSYRDEEGNELLDLPGQPLPPASTRLPVRLLAHWDQPLLAYANRERILPAEIQPLQLTLSGDPTVTVNGRVAASWDLAREGDTVRVTIRPHTDIARTNLQRIRAEVKRTARVCEPDARRVEIAG